MMNVLPSGQIFVPTAVSKSATGHAEAIMLYSNCPDPFNSMTRVESDLPKHEEEVVQVIDFF